jgi:hypothetical protein
MKKILLVLLALILLAVVGLSIFIATFDADRFRPRVVAELEKALGKPVSLQRISLGWQNGIALQLRGLTIHDRAVDEPEPLLQMELGSALVELRPLLRKEIRISSVRLIRPRILASRNAQGQLNLTGLAAAGGPAAAGQAPPQPSAGAPAAGGAQPVAFSIASFRVEDGTVHWVDAMTAPPAELWVRRLDVLVRNIVPGQPMQIELQAALESDAQNVKLSGRFTPPSQGSQGAFEQMALAMDGVDLSRILPKPQPGAPTMTGRLSVDLQGNLPTLDPAALARTAAAQGDIKVADPVLKNLNILREVFNKFAMIPGLVERLQQRLPPDYQAKLSAQDTPLHPIDLPLQLQAGRMQFREVHLGTDVFVLHGNGGLGFDGTLDLQAILKLEPAFSAAMIRSVNELQYLATADGEIEIPLTGSGRAPQIAILPDLDYVASKLLVTKVQEKVQDLLGDLLERAVESEQPADPAASPAVPPAEPVSP